MHQTIMHYELRIMNYELIIILQPSSKLPQTSLAELAVLGANPK